VIGPSEAGVRSAAPAVATADYLVLDNVWKRFRDTPAVAGISLSVKEGELLVLLGPSGCGKSTTLNLIAGFLQLDDGDILLDGRSIARAPVHKRDIGVVFQRYTLFPHMTIFENVAFGLRRRRVRDQELRKRVHDKLEMVGLGSLAERYPHQLSGGQQQRVAVARALAIRPRLMLFDEPLSNLDARLRVELRTEIRNLVTAERVTTVFVTHDQEEAIRVADRIAVLNQGRVLQHAPPRDIYSRPASLFVADFLGRSNKLCGAVERQVADQVVLRLPDGSTLTGIAMQPLEVGQGAVAITRPESVILPPSQPAGDAFNSVHRRLDAEAFTGQAIELTFQGGFVADRPIGDSLEVGREYPIHFPIASTLVYAEAG
jgi:putative spermidine/putrescine transport system ATP-binding protein